MIVSPISIALREIVIAPRLTRALSTPCHQMSKMPWAVQSRSASSVTKQLNPFCSRRQPILYTVLPRKPVAARPESSLASPPANATATVSSPTSPPGTPTAGTGISPTLTWNRFLHLRAIRRRFNLVASMTTALATTAAGLSLLSQQDLDKLGNLLFGLDPIMAMGVGAVGCGAVGWLLGPFAGNAAFGIWYRRLGPEIAVVSAFEICASTGGRPAWCTLSFCGHMYTNKPSFAERERVLPAHQTLQGRPFEPVDGESHA